MQATVFRQGYRPCPISTMVPILVRKSKVRPILRDAPDGARIGVTVLGR